MPNYRVELVEGEDVPISAHRVVGDGGKIHFQKQVAGQWYAVHAFAVGGGAVRCIRNARRAAGRTWCSDRR